MAFASGNLTVLLLNGYDVGPYFKSVSLPGTADVYETTAFGKTNKVYIGGLTDGTLAAQGFYDATGAGLVGSDPYLAAALAAASSIWTVYPFGDALGASGRGHNGITTKYEITAPVSGVVAVSAESHSIVGPERVLSLHALSSIASGTVNGSSIDNTVSSANGGEGYLQVTAEAATTATIKVQHSTDNSVWVDLITFTAVTAAPAKERIAVTGTVNRYLRYTSTATISTITAQVSFGRK